MSSAEHATRSLQRFANGTLVRVLPSDYWRDGLEGIYTVVGELPNAHGAPDYYLARGYCSERHMWDAIVHPCRLEPAEPTEAP